MINQEDTTYKKNSQITFDKENSFELKRNLSNDNINFKILNKDN